MTYPKVSHNSTDKGLGVPSSPRFPAIEENDCPGRTSGPFRGPPGYWLGEATAVWMVQEYGRAVAESRARSAAEFYGAHSADGAYWRRVLAEITASPR